MRQKHPWVYSGGVKLFPKAKKGEIVAVCDNHEQVLGYAFYDANSQIVCKVFEFGNAVTNSFSTDYWYAKLRKALYLRQQFKIPHQTQAYRLVHAEADNFPGLVIDIYHHTAVVHFLHKGAELLSGIIFEFLKTEAKIEYIYTKVKNLYADTDAQKNDEATWATTTPQQPLLVKENGLTFEINVEKGQKTGFFIDQRDNRELLKNHCRGKTVLNTFCYTGGFSVYALAGNASHVTSVDISKEAIEICERNVLHNFPHASHTAIADDCFSFLKNSPDTYDVIVLDPPAFTKSAKNIGNASRGYKELNLLGLKKINSNGIIFTFSCSQNISMEMFKQIVCSAALESGKTVKIIGHLSQPADHPIHLFHPESEYLKGLVLLVE